MNSDGSFLNSISAGASFILCNNVGLLLHAECCVVACESSFSAEVKGFLLAFQYCAVQRLSEVVFESDNKLLVDIICHNLKLLWRHIDDIDFIRSRFHEKRFHIVHCFQESNMVVDFLTNYTEQSSSSIFPLFHLCLHQLMVSLSR